MSILLWRTFGGQRPRLSSRLLPFDGAEIAMNAKLWNGKLRPFRQAKDVFTTVKPGPIKSIFNYRFDSSSAWLHWGSDVDVATSPLANDTNARLYFTGDGRPKVTDKTLATMVQRTVATEAPASQSFAIMNGPSKGFAVSDTILINYGASTQNAVVTGVNQNVGVDTFTLSFTPALNAILAVGRTITNTSSRFPLGAYDLGVPAPALALDQELASAQGGNLVSVSDIAVTSIGSTSTYDNEVTLSVAANNGDTSLLYDPVAFPSETFAVGDRIDVRSESNFQSFQIQSVGPSGGNVAIGLGMFGQIVAGGGFPVGAKVSNTSRGASALVEKPTTLLQLTEATTKQFTTGPDPGAESIQIDVDNSFKVVLGPGAVNAYQNTVGTGGAGQFRFTHYIRRESDGVFIFSEPHTWQIKDGFVQTPSTEGEAFKTTIVDNTPDTGSVYTVGTMVDMGEKIYTSAASTVTVSTKITVRRANRLQVVLENATHGLQVGDRIKLDVKPLSSEFGATSIDNKSVEVTAVSAQFLTVEGQIGGKYDFGGTYTQVFQDDEISQRSYIYTYVATIGGQEMEGAPSPPTPVFDAGISQTVTVSGFVNPRNPLLWDTNFTAIRLYRFQEADDGTGAYLFHSEIPVTGPGAISPVVDTKRGDELLEPVSTIGYLTPPEDLRGLIELENGLVAAFTGKTLAYPVPFQLHAWPVANQRAVHDNIVALGAFGNSVVITAQGRPRTLTGDDPATVTPDLIELTEPNMSKRGTVDMGYGIAYPSPRGLVLVALGRTEMVTEDMFTRDEWQELNPASFIACKYDDRYLCFYDTGGRVPSFTEHSRGGFIIDPKALERKARLVFLDFWATEAWDDPDTGTTYIVQDGIIKEFDSGELEHEYVWRGKPYVLPYAQEMSVMRIESRGRPVRVTVLVEDQPGSINMVPLISQVRHDAEDFRLPAGLYQRWQVEVRSVHEIENIVMASSEEELRRYVAGQ